MFPVARTGKCRNRTHRKLACLQITVTGVGDLGNRQCLRPSTGTAEIVRLSIYSAFFAENKAKFQSSATGADPYARHATRKQKSGRLICLGTKLLCGSVWKRRSTAQWV